MQARTGPPKANPMSHPKTIPLFSVAILFAVSLALSGCDQIFDDRNARAADRADKKSAEGDFQAAIQLYEQALDGTEKTADLHYKLAVIHDDKLNDPIGALHHFRRYLELAPKGSHAKDVRSIVKQDELKLAATLNNAGTMTQKDAAQLKNENLALLKKNTELREQARFNAQTAQQQHQKGAKTVEVQQQKPIPPGAKTYVVAHGDTLASISRKFYKGPARWKDIQDANFNTLEGTAKLKPGMTLVIP